MGSRRPLPAGLLEASRDWLDGLDVDAGAALDDWELAVVYLKHGLRYRQREAAEALGVNQQRVSVLERRAIAQLRAAVPEEARPHPTRSRPQVKATLKASEALLPRSDDPLVMKYYLEIDRFSAVFEDAKAKLKAETDPARRKALQRQKYTAAVGRGQLRASLAAMTAPSIILNQFGTKDIPKRNQDQ